MSVPSFAISDATMVIRSGIAAVLSAPDLRRLAHVLASRAALYDPESISPAA